MTCGPRRAPVRSSAIAAVCAGLLAGMAAGGISATAGGPVQMQLTATRDVWVSSHPDEANTSMGKTDRLKLKAHDEVALLDFDVSGLVGSRVVAAELWMHNVGDTTAGEKERLGIPPSRPDCLRKIGISTVSSPWAEGSQPGTYEADPVGHGATYNEASYGQRDWAYPGSKLYDVVMGNGHSLHWHTKREYQGDGWWKASVDPRLVSAMVAGLSHGLLVAEESSTAGWIAANNYVHSRESGAYAPYLLVTSERSDSPAPAAPRGVTVEPDPDFATLTQGAARVSTFAPEGAVGYRVRVNGAEVGRWQVPLAGAAGEWQQFVLEGLPADGELRVEVQAVSGTGMASPVARAEGRSSPARIPPPPLPSVGFPPGEGAPAATARMSIWAYPEVMKVDPITGEAMLEAATDLRAANAVWDGARSLVRLPAAKGEIVAFQLAVEAPEGPLRDVRIEATDLRGPSGVIGKEHVRLFRTWYVKADDGWHEEYAIPLSGPFDVPAADNAVVGQTVQAVYVDIVVPGTAVPGTYRGRIAAAEAGGSSASAEVELVVYPVTIPNEIHFSPELNSYGPPGEKAGSPYFYEAHRLAHYHRCTINTVHYSHSGRTIAEYVPELSGAGASAHVSDWSEFDRIFGPLFDGAAFEGNPRGRVPVRAFYLPLHENWPLPLLDYYAFREPPRNAEVIVRHQLEAPAIDEALPETYKAGFRNVTRDFAAHFAEKGWTGTDFQMYLNNKYQYWGATYWTLDEPTCRDDWQAIRLFAQLYKSALDGAQGPRFVFRGDISRPWWQYDQLDGLMDAMYYGGGIFDLPEFARRYNRRIPDPHVYGACNEVAAPNLESAVWCLKAYVLGMNGVLPWSSIGDGNSLIEPNQTGLIVPGDRAGYGGPVASLRVFALRRGAQDVELLRMLAEERGYSREQIGALVAQRVPLGARLTQTSADDAAALEFGGLSAQGLTSLKEGVLLLLSE